MFIYTNGLKVISRSKMSDQRLNNIQSGEHIIKTQERFLNHNILARYIPDDAKDFLNSQENALLPQVYGSVREIIGSIPAQTFAMLSSFVNVNKLCDSIFILSIIIHGIVIYGS